RPGSVEGPGGAHGDLPGANLAPRSVRGDPRDARAPREEPGAGTDGVEWGGLAETIRRPVAAEADPSQPAVEQHQVHTSRRRGPPRCRSDRGGDQYRRPRYGCRDPGRGRSAALPRVRATRAQWERERNGTR